jgi:hypothetical protein
MIPLSEISGAGGAIATGSVETGFAFAAHIVVGWEAGASIGCLLQCAEDSCSYYFVKE